MKIITKKEQIIAGMVVNLWSSQGNLDIARFTITDKAVETQRSVLHVQILELVSYPERRKVTFEWLKDNLEDYPDIWLKNDRYTISAINTYQIILDCGGILTPFNFDQCFIDPPHQEVEDVTPPWKIEKESAVSSELDNKIKRLWWCSKKDRLGGMTVIPATEKEFIEDVLNREYADKYAPGPIVPDESEWKEVK